MKRHLETHKICVMFGALLMLTCALWELGVTVLAGYHNSDVLYAEEIMQDLILYHGHWTDWYFPPAPSYFPDLLLYLVGYLALPTVPQHICFVTICDALMLGGLTLWLARGIKRDLSYKTAAALIVLLAYVVTCTAYSNIMLFFSMTNMHVTSMLLSLASYGLLLSYLERQNRLAAGLLVFTAMLAIPSDEIYILCFIAPVGFALAVALFFSHCWPEMRKFRRALTLSLILVMACQLAGKITEHFLTPNNALDKPRVPLSWDGAWHSFGIFGYIIRHVFAPDEFISFSLSLLVLAVLLYLYVRLCIAVRPGIKNAIRRMLAEQRHPDWRLRVTCGFLVIIIPVNVIGAIVSGGLIDPGGIRYFTFPIILSFIVAVLLLESDRFCGRKIIRGLSAVAAFSPLMIAVALPFLPASVLGRPVPDTQGNEIAKCLADMQKNGIELDAGISEYWLGRGVTYLLPKQNPILTMDGNLSIFDWMMTIGPVHHPELYNRHYNFVIMPEPGLWYTPADFNTVAVGKQFPAGYKSYPCVLGTAEIWVYPGSRLDEMVKTVGGRLLFKNGLSDYVRFPGSSLQKISGHAAGADLVAAEPQDQAGLLNAGPYADLKHGHYKVEIDYTGHAEGKQIPGNWEIIGRPVGRFWKSSGVKTIYAGPLPNAGHGLATAIVEVSGPKIELAEIRTYFSGHGRLAVHSLTVTKID